MKGMSPDKRGNLWPEPGTPQDSESGRRKSRKERDKEAPAR